MSYEVKVEGTGFTKPLPAGQAKYLCRMRRIFAQLSGLRTAVG
jgi:hypothetical protein